MWENLANFCMSEERKILCHLKSWNKPFHIHVYHTINSCIPVLKQCLSLVTKDVFVGTKMCGYWNINTWTVLVKLCCSAGTMYPQKKVIAVYIWLQNAGFLVGKMSPNLVYELWLYLSTICQPVVVFCNKFKILSYGMLDFILAKSCERLENQLAHLNFQLHLSMWELLALISN